MPKNERKKRQNDPVRRKPLNGRRLCGLCTAVPRKPVNNRADASTRDDVSTRVCRSVSLFLLPLGSSGVGGYDGVGYTFLIKGDRVRNTERDIIYYCCMCSYYRDISVATPLVTAVRPPLSAIHNSSTDQSARKKPFPTECAALRVITAGTYCGAFYDTWYKYVHEV